MGNITRDTELKYLPSGTAVNDFSIAVNEKRKSQSGEWLEDVSFFDITAFGKTAEIISQYLGKGSPVLVEGRLKQETWEKDGQKRSKVKVICERMQMIGSKGEGQPAGQASQPSQGGTSHDPPADPAGEPDIPF
jgi:single-strand DNA-binding protein